MADSIFGFGKVKIQDVYGNSVTFDNGYGTVSYTPQYRKFEADNGYITRELKGYRVNINIELWNIDSTDAANMALLIPILNSNYPLIIMPRLNPDHVYLELTDCDLTSPFEPKDLAKFEVGQSLNLSFEKRDLASSIPAVFTSSSYQNLVAEDDATLITESGDTLILFEG